MKYRAWLIFLVMAAMVTLVAATVFAAVQQNYRSNANDPQVEAVETLEQVLKQGVPPELITSQGDTVDMKNSLALFVMIFDKDGKSLASSGKLGESSPTPPAGVFDYLRAHDYDRFTWEPEKGVRVAAVGKKLSDDKGFVIVGKSLKEVENRIQNLGIIVAIPWLALLLLSGLLSYLLSKQNSTTILQETEIIAVTEKTPEDTAI
jgi:hypothetical protein